MSTNEKIVKGIFETLIFIVKMFAVTLVYGVIALALFKADKAGWLIAFVVCSLVFTAFSLFSYEQRPYGFVTGDVVRAKRRFERFQAKKRGNQFLLQTRLIDKQDGELRPVYVYDDGNQVRLEIEKAIVGVPAQKLIETARAYKNLFDAETVSVKDKGKGKLSVRFIRQNPLDEVVVMDSLPEFIAETMSVDCAINEAGETRSISFKEVAGVLVSGMPGSGKTAGVSSFLAPLALSEQVELTVIDCKGGTDWSMYEQRSKEFISVGSPEDLEQVRDALIRARREMVERLSTQKEVLGVSNFWNAKDRKNLRFNLIVIDECQELFVKQTDKELAKVATDVQNLVTTLVKRGRSAGVCVLLITQKPTSDSVPTSIRDNCGLRIAFRLDTVEAEKAALGGVPDDIDVPRAMNIPSNRKGGAVLVDDRGGRESVRFNYIPESELEEVLNV